MGMNVKELFRRLSHGELSNLAISGEGSGDIIDEKKPKILVHANEGLNRIFSRFVLRERTLLIEMMNDITTYKLHPMHARSNASLTDVPHYIIDNDQDKFTDDLVRVLSAHAASGMNLPLNEEGRPDSLFTPKTNELQVPFPVNGHTISLTYQALHRPLVDGNETQQIDLPIFLEGALTAIIAYHVYSGMNTQEAKATAQEHINNYEAICVEVEQKNMLGTGSTTSMDKFTKNGWA